MEIKTISRGMILVIALGISLLFLLMIRGFFDAVLLGAVFAGILYKINVYFQEKTGKKVLAATITLILFIFMILLPVSFILIIIVEQAINLTENIGPRIDNAIHHPDSLMNSLRGVPIIGDLLPEKEKLIEILSNLVEGLGNFVVSHLSDISSGTANFFLEFFIFLYCLYYFLLYGETYLERLFYILPLNTHDEKLLFSRFTKVTRATLKGTLFIGMIQGGIGYIGFLIIGVPNSLFWGLIMIITSIIPAVGPALVWIPASLYLITMGQLGSAIFIIILGAVVIGNIDNILRPKLVGKDAGMPDLMILLSTLGGLALFGISGLITGPIVAALFITIWDIYSKTFKDFLYPVEEGFLSDDNEQKLATDQDGE